MSASIRIVVASGKGGTGKTTVATNLAVALAELGHLVAYLDCDVEEPNGHLFLKPNLDVSRDVTMSVPVVDEASCNQCGLCGKVCQYSAIVALPKKVLALSKLCHGCGGCLFICPQQAIHERERVTGVVELGNACNADFLQGRLSIGESMSPPVIRAVLRESPIERIQIIDAPPGTSCPVIASVKTADVVLLVTEPTPFGLNDLKLAVEMVRALSIPMGVAINRSDSGNDEVRNYCRQEKIPVLFELGNDGRIARAYSEGQLAITVLPELKASFVGLYQKLGMLAQAPAVVEEKVEVVLQSVDTRSDALPFELVSLGKPHYVKELVVISGKGGTGKTSLVASLSAFADKTVLADCDVDAADLHLLLAPRVRCSGKYVGGKTAFIDPVLCVGCGACVKYCRFEAIRRSTCVGSCYVVDNISCEGCGVCASVCSRNAITMNPTNGGEWFISDTNYGPMVHAQLGVAQENSGKLVSLVRKQATHLARTECRQLIITDGPPGIGCPVIAAVTGATLALVVAEPTVSGLHDLRRVIALCKQLNVNASVCINKVGINSELELEIANEAAHHGLPLLGRIRYDATVTLAQVKKVSVVEYGDGFAAQDIRKLWKSLESLLAV